MWRQRNKPRTNRGEGRRTQGRDKEERQKRMTKMATVATTPVVKGRKEREERDEDEQGEEEGEDQVDGETIAEPWWTVHAADGRDRPGEGQDRKGRDLLSNFKREKEQGETARQDGD